MSTSASSSSASERSLSNTCVCTVARESREPRRIVACDGVYAPLEGLKGDEPAVSGEQIEHMRLAVAGEGDVCAAVLPTETRSLLRPSRGEGPLELEPLSASSSERADSGRLPASVAGEGSCASPFSRAATEAGSDSVRVAEVRTVDVAAEPSAESEASGERAAALPARACRARCTAASNRARYIAPALDGLGGIGAACTSAAP